MSKKDLIDSDIINMLEEQEKDLIEQLNKYRETLEYLKDETNSESEKAMQLVELMSTLSKERKYENE